MLTTVLASSHYSNQETVKLHHSEPLKLDNYTFLYDKYDYKDAQYLKIGLDKKRTDLVLRKVENLYKSEGETIEIPEENMSIHITYVGRDDDGRYLNLTINSAKKIFASAELTHSAPDKVIVSQGGSVEVPLELENTGLLDQSFKFSAVENSSISTTFNYQDFNITSVEVDKGEEISLTAKIQIPEKTPTGKHEVELLTEGVTNISKKINIEVRGKKVQKRREMDMDIDNLYKQVSPGETLSVPVDIRNRGETSLENIELETDGPDGWEMSVSPKEVDLDERFDDRTIIVELTAPESVESGDYFLGLSAVSEKTETNEEEVRIHVQKKSGLSYAGIGLMALSLIGLITVYRRFGRR